MKTRTLLPVRVMVALLAISGLAFLAFAAGSYTVTATLYNDNGSTFYTLQSDGNTSAVYGNKGGISSNFSPTTGGGTDYYQWNLDLSNSSRLFYVTLQPNDNASAAAAPFTGPVAFNGVLHSRCFTASGGYQDWTRIQPGYPDGNCAMRVNFTYGGASYTLVMSPDTGGTGTATVSCTKWSTSSKSCVAWTDVPNPSAANPNVAYLYNTTNGQVYVGSYSLSFDVTLTNP